MSSPYFQKHCRWSSECDAAHPFTTTIYGLVEASTPFGTSLILTHLQPTYIVLVEFVLLTLKLPLVLLLSLGVPGLGSRLN
jgi:hypothetical protein